MLSSVAIEIKQATVTSIVAQTVLDTASGTYLISPKLGL